MERALDVIQVCFGGIEEVASSWKYETAARPKMKPEAAVRELNARFKEHGVGYEYAAGEIIRIDSQFIHSAAVKPALDILSAKMYRGANQEFLRAYEHLRHRRYEEAITNALKAFESTLKIICDKRKWPYAQSDTAKQLLAVCFTNGLVPPYLQSEFVALRSTLESGVPTVRNKQSGHGQGVIPRNVPEHLASYILHMTASAILFLAKSDEALP